MVAVAKKQSKLDDYITLQLSSNNSIKNTNRSGSVGQRVARSGSTRLIRPAVEPPPKPSQQQQTNGTTPSKPSTNVKDKPQLVSYNSSMRSCIEFDCQTCVHRSVNNCYRHPVPTYLQFNGSPVTIFREFARKSAFMLSKSILGYLIYIVHHTMENLYSG